MKLTLSTKWREGDMLYQFAADGYPLSAAQRRLAAALKNSPLTEQQRDVAWDVYRQCITRGASRIDWRRRVHAVLGRPSIRT